MRKLAALAVLRSTSSWLLVATITGVVQFIVDCARVRGAFRDVTSFSASAVVACLCMHLTFQAFAMVIGVVTSGAVERFGSDRSARRIAIATIVPLVVCAAPLWIAGVRLASGAWIAEQPFAPIVRAAPLLVATGTLASVSLLLWGPQSSSLRRRTWITGIAFLLSIVVMLADQRVMPGLYPEFHMLVYSMGAVGLLVAIQRLDADWGHHLRWRPRGLLIGCGITLVVAPIVFFTSGMRTRAEVAFYSPTAKHWLPIVFPRPRSEHLRHELAAIDPAAPPLEFEPDNGERGLLTSEQEMNVLFVVVDALRSDAVLPNRPEEGTPFVEPGDTPFLDEWLSHTYRFSRCYTAAPATRMAMPVLFRSIHVFEDPVTDGIPAGRRMEALGLTPIAVVLDWFISGKWPAAEALLDGFDDVLVYEQSENGKVVPYAEEVLDRVGDRRFFAWVHMFQVHDPGFDGRLLTYEDGNRRERYRRALQWSDGAFRELLALLDERGLRDNTIIVFVADHGEGIGTHGTLLHGPNLFEEDVRVPLAIHVPGHEGHVIDDVVGTMDVMPTLVDLLGAPVEPSDRGRSLVPLMAKRESPQRDYYMQNSGAEKVGIVSGTDKLLWEPETDMVFRSDLVEDPKEKSYLWDPDGDVDRLLMRKLIRFNPSVAAHELDDSDTYALLEQHLTEVVADAPTDDLPFLLRLVGLKPSETTLAETARIFEETEDWRLRLLVLKHITPSAGDRIDRAAAAWLKQVSGKRQETEIVLALARQGQGIFAKKTIARRLKSLADKRRPPTWEAYLLLCRPWNKAAAHFAKAYEAMLLKVSESTPPATPRLLELLLDNVASLQGESRELAEVSRLSRPFLENADARVRAAALRAVGNAADRGSLDLVRTTLFDVQEKPRVRREAAQALLGILDKEAVPDLIRASEDPVLNAVVLRMMKKMKDPSLLPFLREQLEAHPSGWIRQDLERLIADLERKESGKPL
jgi:hypothetical protein